MQSEEQRQQVKVATMQALSRLEALALEPKDPAPPTSKKRGMYNELEQLPPPPKTSPKEPGRAATMPRGKWYVGGLQVGVQWGGGGYHA